MRTFYTEEHSKRNARSELSGGALVSPHECPQRATIIRDRLLARGFGDIAQPEAYGLTPILRVHHENFVRFLETAWDEWRATGASAEAIPINWPARRMGGKAPDSILRETGLLRIGRRYVDLRGNMDRGPRRRRCQSERRRPCARRGRAAFALCRPPGHHAARDLFGGYCFLNNAAIAAQSFRDRGVQRCAVLDVDFHHGNGTQDIFYARDDVFFASIHGDPRAAFPFYLGHADETGAGKGEGFNANFPLARGTDWPKWQEALIAALDRIGAFGAEALVVSLGLDAFEGDPISFFKLRSEDFLRLGERIGRLAGRPSSCWKAATPSPRSASTRSIRWRALKTLDALGSPSSL